MAFMRDSRRAVVFAFLFVISFCLAAGSGPKLLTVEQWSADLKFLVEKIPLTHRHAFDRLAPEAFYQAAAELQNRIPALSDHEIVVGLARLVALLRDGHSRLSLPLGSREAVMPGHMPTAEAKAGIFLRVLPVKFYWFSDGLAVIAASEEYKELLGATVQRIGDMESGAALEAVRPVVNYDSEMWYKNWSPVMLAVPEILHAQGVAASPDGVELTVRLRNGSLRSVRLPAADPAQPIAWSVASELAAAEKPLYLSRQGDPFWFNYDEKTRLFYCQVNEITNSAEETLAQFAARMVTAAEARPVAKFVLDLRRNGGGNNYLNRALLLALVRSPRLNRYGTLFVVIGRTTFSAAQNLVNDLEKWSNAIFVGEPTGNSPSMYGDAKRLVLPNSRLTVRLSSVYWRDSSVDEKRPWVAADIVAPLTLADYLENRDPALVAILSYHSPASFLDELKEKFAWGGMDNAAGHYYKFRNSPETAAMDTEAALLGMAGFLENRSDPAAATQILQLAAREYPKSFAVQLATGRMAVLRADKVKALEYLKKALSLRPHDPQAKEWLAKAEALPSA